MKRVRLCDGARPPGRSPRRTSRTGAAERDTISERTVPTPSSRQREERPTTTSGARVAPGLRGEQENRQQRRDAERRHRRLLLFAVGALVAFAAMAALAVFALTQRSQARSQARLAAQRAADANRQSLAARDASARAAEASKEARTEAAQARDRLLVAAALARLDTDPELSMLLASQAARFTPTPEVERVLRRALLASRLRYVLPADGAVNTAVYGLGGTRALTASDDGNARIFDTATGLLLYTLAERRSSHDRTIQRGRIAGRDKQRGWNRSCLAYDDR